MCPAAPLRRAALPEEQLAQMPAAQQPLGLYILCFLAFVLHSLLRDCSVPHRSLAPGELQHSVSPQVLCSLPCSCHCKSTKDLQEALGPGAAAAGTGSGTLHCCLG